MRKVTRWNLSNVRDDIMFDICEVDSQHGDGGKLSPV